MPALALDAIWAPLPASEWNESAARHLLRRIGWAATSETVAQALAAGLPATLERAFPATPPAFAEPASVTAMRAYAKKLIVELRDTPKAERRAVLRDARERSRRALLDLTLDWLQVASAPNQAAFEKWLVFLGDVYVVAAVKVRNPALIYDHLGTLRQHALGPAPVLTKAVSRSPAMIDYLDLQQNKRDAPNENFARELLELFVLGEGHYTEADIKNAARAFTGYRQRAGEFIYQRRQHDDSPKTVFGHTGDYSGDDVINLAYRQPAAERFLPGEMVRYYLSDQPLPAESIARLGAWWRDTGFDLRRLALRFFGSRQFFAPAYRGNYIKSPVQFYLGLLQHLQLDVTPLPRFTLVPLQQMGQTMFNPPNVRGWVGGRTWINSVTLEARRQLVQNLFNPIDPTRLNADEQIDLVAAQTNGHGRFTVDPAAARRQYAGDDADAIARELAANFLPAPVSPEFSRTVSNALLQDGAHAVTPASLCRVMKVLLQTPEYQLC